MLGVDGAQTPPLDRSQRDTPIGLLKSAFHRNLNRGHAPGHHTFAIFSRETIMAWGIGQSGHLSDECQQLESTPLEGIRSFMTLDVCKQRCAISKVGTILGVGSIAIASLISFEAGELTGQ